MIDTSFTRELIQAGFRISLAGGKLRVEPASKLSDGLRKRISSHKLEIIAELQRRATATTPRLAPEDAPPCPSDITERAAIFEEGDQCDRATAEKRALAEFGFTSSNELADAHRVHILARLDELPSPNPNDQNGGRLLKETREFLNGEHWPQAIALGWPMLEMFGINPNAPQVRVDGQGLVTGLALSSMLGGQLETIAEDHATIRYRSGSLFTYCRGMPGLDASVLWWSVAAIVRRCAFIAVACGGARLANCVPWHNR
jgi:hypothetical protein